MTWAQEQIIQAARIVFDELMRIGDLPRAHDIYYQIGKYKAECRRRIHD